MKFRTRQRRVCVGKGLPFIMFRCCSFLNVLRNLWSLRLFPFRIRYTIARYGEQDLIDKPCYNAGLQRQFTKLSVIYLGSVVFNLFVFSYLMQYTVRIFQSCCLHPNFPFLLLFADGLPYQTTTCDRC